MRSTLYIFAVLWFIVGLALLALAVTLEPVPVLQFLQPPPVGAPVPDVHPLFGNYRTYFLLLLACTWILFFCVPALLFTALAALLGRLDRLHQDGLAERARESAASRKRAYNEKVEPHIGRV